MMEVAQHIGGDTVRCIMLSPSEGIGRGDEVLSTGRTIEAPVGEATLGRMFNVLGQPIDSYLIHDSGPFRLPKFGTRGASTRCFFLHGHETDHQYYAQDELGGGLKAEDYYEDHVMEKAERDPWGTSCARS